MMIYEKPQEHYSSSVAQGRPLEFFYQPWQTMSSISLCEHGYGHVTKHLGSLSPGKLKINVTAYRDIRYNCLSKTKATFWSRTTYSCAGQTLRKFGHMVYLEIHSEKLMSLASSLPLPWMWLRLSLTITGWEKKQLVLVKSWLPTADLCVCVHFCLHSTFHRLRLTEFESEQKIS